VSGAQEPTWEAQSWTTRPAPPPLPQRRRPRPFRRAQPEAVGRVRTRQRRASGAGTAVMHQEDRTTGKEGKEVIHAPMLLFQGMGNP